MENKIREAMCHLDADLVQEAAMPFVRARRALRSVLIVACLVAMLSMMVMAAGVIGNEQWRIQFRENAPADEQLEVEATYGGTVLRLESVDELKTAAETGWKYTDADGMLNIVLDTKKSFENLAEVEHYLDVDLLETPLKPVEDCFLRAFYSPEEDALYVDVHYRGDQPSQNPQPTNLHINAYICTAADVTLSILSSLSEERRVQEYYIDSLGVASYLIQEDRISRGYFNVEGVAYEVSALGDAQDMQQILETFQ